MVDTNTTISRGWRRGGQGAGAASPFCFSFLTLVRVSLDDIVSVPVSDEIVKTYEFIQIYRFIRKRIHIKYGIHAHMNSYKVWYSSYNSNQSTKNLPNSRASCLSFLFASMSALICLFCLLNHDQMTLLFESGKGGRVWMKAGGTRQGRRREDENETKEMCENIFAVRH